MYKTVSIHSRSTYWSNKEASDELLVDSDDLAREIENVSNNLSSEGYEVVAVTPINSGTISNGNGYYQTESIVITAKLVKK
jgi:hypothetical protein